MLKQALTHIYDGIRSRLVGNPGGRGVHALFRTAGGCRGSLTLFLLLCFLSLSAGEGATTLLVGRVTDRYDGQPLASVNVRVKGTDAGTATDDAGYFLLRTDGEAKRIVFSSVGYKTEEVRLKAGHSAFITVAMDEQNTLLQDVFVLPGTNPALEWMERIRLARTANDLTARPGYEAESTVQSLVLLSRTDGAAGARRLFRQFVAGNLSADDSTLLAPLYMAETRYRLTHRGREETARRLYSTPEETDRLVMQLTEGLDPDFNFYRNAVSLFGKSIVSPLANIGNAYYRYYLADSLPTACGKEYEIHFHSKNPKNLAFDGTFRFDSATLALTRMEATLPRQAGINYVRGMTVKQRFAPQEGGGWALSGSELSLGMAYDLTADSLPRRTELVVSQSSRVSAVQAAPDTLAGPEAFARSGYSAETLQNRMDALGNTPLMRTAKWIADAALTGYARAGWVDFGRLQDVIRLTDLEGVRLALPLRTNERLWENISIGGRVGYGLRERKLKFSAFGAWRLPVERRHVLELSYTDDNRRTDYDYNAYMRRESPWDQGDEDIVSTVLSFLSGRRMSPRREWQLSYTGDWGGGFETGVYLRAHELFSQPGVLPLAVGGVSVSSLRRQSLTLTGRWSFGERSYDDHLQRIYVRNSKPVVYATAEAGRYEAGGRSGWYGKVIASLRQHVPFAIGEWNYTVEAGCVIGRVPYPLLEYTPGNEPSGIAYHQFNRMRYMEFGHDRYVRTIHEVVFNGVLFNRIPLIKHLNMRELVAVKAVVGGLSDRHRAVMDFPDLPHYLHPMCNPYVEASVGVTNVLGIFTLQFNYRLTNNYPGITPGRFSFGLRFGF